MWLTEIERRVLVYCYNRAKSINDWVEFDPRKDDTHEFTEGINRLLRRKFINMGYQIGKDGKRTGVWSIHLTVAGWDLAQKYSNWFTRTGLWYQENLRHHWLWPIITFILGILAGILINRLS